VLQILARDCGFTTQSVVADIGSGTGKLTRLFLENGNCVYAVEPNDEMRQAAEQELGGFVNFTSLAKRAEETGLAEHSVDFVTAAQAFHWFDPVLARREFERILRPGGWVALMWNERDRVRSEVVRQYQDLIWSYSEDNRQKIEAQADVDPAKDFFAPQPVAIHILPNPQVLSLEHLKGAALSASYAPMPGHPNYAPLLAALEAFFQKHQVDGRLYLDYDTRMYIGRLA
jgi:SAM-dependent methyltransferase